MLRHTVGLDLDVVQREIKTRPCGLNGTKNRIISYRELDTTCKTRFIDIPIYLAETPLALVTRLHSPEAVLLLLRFGAKIALGWNQQGQIKPPADQCGSLQDALEMLLVSDSDHWHLTNCHPQAAEEVELCLAFFLRTVTRVLVERIRGKLGVPKAVPVHPGWVDLIPRNRNQDPCELRHLCRITIRHELHKGGYLPYGIDTLPLPTRLREYLDLLHD